MVGCGGSRAARMRRGGRLVDIGAGLSGLLAQMDGLNLPRTCGIAEDQVKVIIAGGLSTLRPIEGIDEEDGAASVIIST